MKILKFGGSSVGNAESIKLVSELVKADSSKEKVVVVSAQQGITDMLLSLIDKPKQIDNIKTRLDQVTTDLNINVPKVSTLLNELNDDLTQTLSTEQQKDNAASYGELFSIEIISAYFNTQGIKAKAVDARQLVVTDNTFNNANYCLTSTTTNCKQQVVSLIKEGIVPIVAGFIGSTKEGETTTLGRGGSDLTATLIGQCLNAEVIEIWSDADGIMTADPRKIKNSTVIPQLSYKEAVELSNFGAKIIYGRSLIPAIEGNIPVHILNTFNPDSKGSLIHDTHESSYYAVTSKNDVAIITIYNPKMIGAVGYLASLFNTFKTLNLSIDVISVSEASVSVTIEHSSQLDPSVIRSTLKEFGAVDVKENCAIVAIISSHLKQEQELFSSIMKKLRDAQIHINLISYGNSEINFTLVIEDSNQSTKAVEQLHELLQRD